MPSTYLGITYPCLTPLVNPADFTTYALSVESALSATFAQVPPLLNRDFVATFAATPNVAAGVNTTVSWSTPSATDDPNGMFNPGTPTLFTLQSSGSFLVTLDVSNGAAITTGTSLRAAVLLNGAEQIWAKWPGDGGNGLPAFGLSGHLISATAGQQVTCTMLWTGTGGPTTPNFVIRISKISNL